MVGNRCNYGGIMTNLDSMGIFSQVSDGGAMKFVPLNQGKRFWYGMCAAPNGDIYACCGGMSVATFAEETNIPKQPFKTTEISRAYVAGDIFKQTGGVGDFISLGQADRNWSGLTALPNGDIYALVTMGSGYHKYKQTGIGDFVEVWESFPVTRSQWPDNAPITAPDGAIYSLVDSGYTTGSYIKKQIVSPPGSYNLFTLNDFWFMEVSPTGDVWLGANADVKTLDETTRITTMGIRNRGLFLKKSTANSFINTMEKGRSWSAMAFAPNGDIYACAYASYGGSLYNIDPIDFELDYGSDIYKLMEI